MKYPQSPFLRNPLVESQILKGNPSLIQELIPWLCQTPKVTTYRVNLLTTQRETFKSKLCKYLSTKYNCLPSVLEQQNLPEVICIGTVQNKCEQTQDVKDLKEIIVDTICGAALLRGAHVFAPGVLAMETGTKKGEQVKIYADLSKKCKKGTSIRFESDKKLFIGIGIVHMQRHQIYNADSNCSGIAIEMQWTLSEVPSIGNINLDDEEALLQNLPSIITVRVLNPQSNEYILDMCSAPGNKTTHIIEMMKDKGIVIALDKTETKIKLVKAQVERHNYKSIQAYTFDSTKLLDISKLKRETFEPPFVPNSFDRILLDAPCSALGNRPLLRNDMTVKMLESYPCIQKKLFENAVHLLKVNGVLVYSTCTITEDENEGMVAWALKKYPQLKLVKAEPTFGGPGLPNVGLNDEERKLVQRFGPSHWNLDKNIDTVGFFIAKFVKTTQFS